MLSSIYSQIVEASEFSLCYSEMFLFLSKPIFFHDAKILITILNFLKCIFELQYNFIGCFDIKCHVGGTGNGFQMVNPLDSVGVNAVLT